MQMSEAWELAKNQIVKAQKTQKRHYDRRSTAVKYSVGDREFVLMPSAKNTKAYKFARPFFRPYRVVVVHPTGLEVRPVDRPHAPTIRVALNRVRRCPDEISDTFWPRHGNKNQNQKAAVQSPNEESDQDHVTDMEEGPVADVEPDQVTEIEPDHVPVVELNPDPTPSEPNTHSVWRGRLRSRVT